MANPAYVQAVGGTGSTVSVSSLVLTLAVNTTAGNMLLAFVKTSSSRSVTSFVDSLGNTWTKDVDATAIVSRLSIWRSHNANPLKIGDTITASFSAVSGDALVVHEYSGVTNSSPLDTSSANNSSTTVTSLATGATGTTAAANDLVITYAQTGSTQASFTPPGSPYTERSIVTNPYPLDIADYVEPSITAIPSATWSWPTSSNCNVGILTYKASSASSATNSNFLMFMGG